MKQEKTKGKNLIVEKNENVIVSEKIDKNKIEKNTNNAPLNEKIFNFEKITKIQNNDDAKTDGFFDKILAAYEVEKPLEKIACITVSHVVPTLPYFLTAVAKIGRIAGVIAKSAFVDPRVEKEIKERGEKQGYKLHIDSTGQEKYKKDFLDPKKAIGFFKEIIKIKEGEKFIIIDIGGYFAQCLPELSNDHDIRNSLLGIVEDTENGHQKYEKVIAQSEFPVMSVARSFLKETEDYNVGKSIVYAADTILRINAHTITPRFKNVTVIGYGKIGRSIAEHLWLMRINPCICEKSVELQMLAESRGFKIIGITEIHKSDLIFSATGNKALNTEKMQQLKDNVFIVSVTSNNDEFDFEFNKTNKYFTQYILEGYEHVTLYEDKKTEKKINFINNGNAANFVYGGVNGPYIYSVQAELLVCLLKLARKKEKISLKEIKSIERNDMKEIAKIWLNTYEDVKLYKENKPIQITNNDVVKTTTTTTSQTYINNNNLNNNANVKEIEIVEKGKKNKETRKYYEFVSNDELNENEQNKQRKKCKKNSHGINTSCNPSNDEIIQDINFTKKNEVKKIYSNCGDMSYLLYPTNQAFKEIERPELEKIREHFSNTNVTINTLSITGLFGVGKTTLAKQYITKYNEEYQCICWFYGKNHDSLLQVIEAFLLERQFGNNIPDGNEQDKEQRVKLGDKNNIRTSFYKEIPDNTLVIVDDIQEIADIKKLLPQNYKKKIHFLFISRKKQNNNINNIHLDNFSIQETKKLFEKNLGDNFINIQGNGKQYYTQLCEAFSGHPLALKNALIYINNQKTCTIEDYLRLKTQCDNNESPLWNINNIDIGDLNDNNENIYKKAVITSFELTPIFQERNNQKYQKAVDVFTLMCCLSNKNIIQDILKCSSYPSFNLLTILQQIEPLQNYYLVEAVNNCFVIHDFIKEIMLKNVAKNKNLLTTLNKAFYMLYFFEEDKRKENWKEYLSFCEQLILHYESIVNIAENNKEICDINAINVTELKFKSYWRVGSCYYQRGLMRKAKEIYLQAQKLGENLKETEEISKIKGKILLKIASASRERGNVSDGSYEKAMDFFKKKQLNNTVDYLHLLNRYSKYLYYAEKNNGEKINDEVVRQSLKLAEEAFELHKKIYPDSQKNKSNDIKSKRNLAIIYNNLGNAHHLLGKIKLLSSKNPNEISPSKILEFNKAIENFGNAMELAKGVDEATLGTTYGHLYELYCLKKDYNNAEKYQKLKIDLREKSYGSSHPYTIAAKRQLAAFYRDVKIVVNYGNSFIDTKATDVKSAIEVYCEAIKKLEEELKKTNSNEKYCYSLYQLYRDLGWTYIVGKQWENAEKAKRKAIDILESDYKETQNYGGTTNTDEKNYLSQQATEKLYLGEALINQQKYGSETLEAFKCSFEGRRNSFTPKADSKEIPNNIKAVLRPMLLTDQTTLEKEYKNFLGNFLLHLNQCGDADYIKAIQELINKIQELNTTSVNDEKFTQLLKQYDIEIRGGQKLNLNQNQNKNLNQNKILNQNLNLTSPSTLFFNTDSADSNKNIGNNSNDTSNSNSSSNTSSSSNGSNVSNSGNTHSNFSSIPQSAYMQYSTTSISKDDFWSQQQKTEQQQKQLGTINEVPEKIIDNKI